MFGSGTALAEVKALCNNAWSITLRTFGSNRAMR